MNKIIVRQALKSIDERARDHSDDMISSKVVRASYPSVS